MGTIYKVIAITLILAILLGWLVSLVAVYILNKFRYKKFTGFSTFKRQVVYALSAGLLIWIAGWLVFLTSVEMH